MSCIFCNSNDLYDGIDYLAKARYSASPSLISDRRSVFAEPILFKASKLEDLRRLTGKAMTKTSSILEIVLVVGHEFSARSDLLADLISRLFAMPEDHSNRCLLEVTAVRPHTIREDLAAARSSRNSIVGDSSHDIQRHRVFVGLGSALQGLCLHFCKEEVIRLRLECSRDATKAPPSSPTITAVICVDPPPHLWKTSGRSILEQTSLEGIPLFFVDYTEKDDEGVERIHAGLGELLNDCKNNPHALALVANDSANILRLLSGTEKDENRDFDACFWLARLIIKYAESVQRIRIPPRGASGITPKKGKVPGRSML